MGRPSKKTLAERAVKASLEAAQAFVDDGNDDTFAEAEAAFEDAKAAVDDADLGDDYAATFETIGAMLDVEPPAPAPAPVPADYHAVAEGKALTSKRGVLGPGDRIESRDLAGGERSLKAFVKSGHIVPPAK